MADDIRTMKSYMTGLTMYAGQEIAPIDDPFTIVSIDDNTTQSYLQDFRLAGSLNPNTGEWIFDQLVMTAGATDGDVGGVSFRAWNEQRIDLTGLLQLSAAYVPLGSVSQRAGVPQLPGNYLDKSAAGSLTYMRDFTIWSVEPLTNIDRGNLWSDGITKQSITPNMPSQGGSNGGSMTTTQMLSSQSRLFVIDGSLSSRVGFMRELFQQMGGMGETAAAPHIYCTRLISGQFTTPPRARIGGVVSTSWANDAFWISWPASWELLNVGIITPDDLEYLTYMQRSVLAPGGRVEQ
jgi:hypothetical protein